MFSNKMGERNFKDKAIIYPINKSGTDIDKYFQSIASTVKGYIKESKIKGTKKIKLNVSCKMFYEKVNDEGEKTIKYITAYFPAEYNTLQSMNRFSSVYQSIKDKFVKWIDEFSKRGSGYVLEKNNES